MNSIPELQRLVVDSFDDWQSLGHVNTKTNGDLILFNYTAECAYEGRWNWFERVSRGLILNRHTGEIVARPFDKFFNWGEGGRTTDASIVCAQEKMDGSLGILYRDGGQYKVATRGSFESEQALWATEYLNRNHDLGDLETEFTLLFEIIYPTNRIVVDYGGLESLVLLTARDRFTGRYLDSRRLSAFAARFGFPIPRVYDFSTVGDILQESQEIDYNEEGWVVEFADGQRFKFKGEAYREVHRLISGLSFKNTLEAVANGTVGVLLETVPDEFLEDVEIWIDIIGTREADIVTDVVRLHEMAPKATRKQYALWVKRECPELAPYMFAYLDGRDISPLIYKRAFNDFDLEDWR